MIYKIEITKKKAFVSIFLLVLSCFSVTAQSVRFSFKGGVEDVSLKRTMQKNVSSLLSAINNSVENRYDKVHLNSGITKEALDQVNSLWMKVPFRIDSTLIEDAYCLQKKNGNSLVGFEVRHIEITMMPRKIQEWSYPVKQEICIDFDTKGIITFFTLSMEWHSVKKLLKYGERIDEIDQRFRKVVDFCDQLMTAYCNKDNDMLSKLYDKRAIVVVGRKIGYDKFSYSKISGEQYLKNLAKQFLKLDTLAVRFDDYEIVQHPQDPKLYVVTFKQDWFSKYKNSREYKDCGYVCLVWDFHNDNEPIIHFRSWQPIETKKKDRFTVRHPEVATIPID